ncbi:hypothetical protein CYMTET_49690 [Cymbomonas tetramitiformis]|uniref:Uncharacterized protein n=1 Tax=Cymbomonas tetramitiformis TaxID=36881 RepID=A0AAE0BRD5_9CHLO|nr:hypothetical protein CYMTET_49690 [Cymbomonas tetramitiformis]
MEQNPAHSPRSKHEDTFLEMLQKDGGQLCTALRRIIKYYLTFSFFAGYYNLYLWLMTAIKISLLEEYSVVLLVAYWGFLVLFLVGFLNGLIPVELPPQLFLANKGIMQYVPNLRVPRILAQVGEDVADTLRFISSSESKLFQLKDNVRQLLAEDTATAGFRQARTNASESVRAFALAQPIFRMLVASEREYLIQTMQDSLLAHIDGALHSPDSDVNMIPTQEASCPAISGIGEQRAVVRNFMLDSEKHMLQCFMKLNNSETPDKCPELASLRLFEQRLVERYQSLFEEYLAEQVYNTMFFRHLSETTLAALHCGSALGELLKAAESPVQMPALEEIADHIKQKSGPRNVLQCWLLLRKGCCWLQRP